MSRPNRADQVAAWMEAHIHELEFTPKFSQIARAMNLPTTTVFDVWHNNLKGKRFLLTIEAVQLIKKKKVIRREKI